MKNEELFDACVKQCVWCEEQWPIIAAGGQMLHVGPYTKDRKLFSANCKAAAIREAFEYVGYKGGREIGHKAPTPKKLGESAKASSPSNRAFWRNLTECSMSVSEWPMWKRGVDIDGTKPKPTAPEELKRMREELRYYDALDYWARKECTEGLQYRPTIVKGRVNEPTCNWEIGCVICWIKHDTFQSKLNDDSGY